MKRKIIFLGLFIFATWTHAQENAVTNTYQNKGSKNYIKIRKTGTTYTAEGEIFNYPLKNVRRIDDEEYVRFLGVLKRTHIRKNNRLVYSPHTFGEIEIMIGTDGNFLNVDITDTKKNLHSLILHKGIKKPVSK